MNEMTDNLATNLSHLNLVYDDLYDVTNAIFALTDSLYLDGSPKLAPGVTSDMANRVSDARRLLREASEMVNNQLKAARETLGQRV
jgi:hypothetical protein